MPIATWVWATVHVGDQSGVVLHPADVGGVTVLLPELYQGQPDELFPDGTVELQLDLRKALVKGDISAFLCENVPVNPDRVQGNLENGRNHTTHRDREVVLMGVDK